MVVREGSKELNLPELMLYYPVHPVLSDKRCFDVVQPPRSHLEPPRTHVVLPCTSGSLRQTVVRCGSTTPKSFGTNPYLSQTTLYTRFPQSNGGSRRFKRVEPPRTNVILPCTPGSLIQTMVRAGSKGLNNPEVIWNPPQLMSNYSVHPVPQSSGVSSRFEGVEPPRSHLEPTRTHVKLP